METTFAQRLKELRKEKSLTQPALAKATGLSMSAIRSYENDLRKPNAKAMVAFETFFNVSGAYLAGETDEKEGLYCWENAEIMNEVKSGFPSHLKNLPTVINDCSDHDQKMTFDILVELRHILLLKDENVKAAALELLQGTFSTSTRFVDSCIRTARDCEEERLLKLKQSCIENYVAALTAAQKTIF